MKYSFVVEPEEQGQRLDLLLPQRVVDLSRTAARRVIDIGGVHVDGRRVQKNSLPVREGQLVEYYRDDQPLEPYRLEPDSILYQDEYLLAVNKPAGVDTQPTPSRYKGTLYEAVQLWLGRDRRFGRKLEIGMVQRLDRDTSGVIVFSIHPRAHRSLSEQFHHRQVRKLYLALVAGHPGPAFGSLHSSLARDRRSNRVRSAVARGREARCHYRIVQQLQSGSLVLVELITGRMHQIRAQFAEFGHPLVGDSRYGGPDHWGGRPVSRHCLHSWRLGIAHPQTGELLKLEAPPPGDLVELVGTTEIDGAQALRSVLEAVDRCRHPSAPGDEPARFADIFDGHDRA